MYIMSVPTGSWLRLQAEHRGVQIEARTGIVTRRLRPSPCQCHNAIHRWL